MSAFDFNINNAVVDLSPPDKRYANNIWFLRALIAPIQWIHELFFTSYFEGSTDIYEIKAYPKYAVVNYNGKCYSSLIDGNTDIPTSNTWKLEQSDFVGAYERSTYTNQKLMLEYALNKEFGTAFNYPFAQNEIYISTNTMNLTEFHCATVESNSSSVYEYSSTGYVGNSSTALGMGNFTVNIPISLSYNENYMKSFIERYVAIGLTYKIHNY